MKDQLFAASMFTEGLIDASCIFFASPSEIRQQHLCFETVTNFLPNGADLDGLRFVFDAYLFSLFTASNLSQLHMPGAGIHSFALHIFTPGLPPVPLIDPCQISSSTYRIRRNTMKDSSRSVYFLSPTNPPPNCSSVDFARKEDLNNATQIREPKRFSVGAGPGGKPENVSFAKTRCTEKGCVFPASRYGHGKCSYHLHEQEEPVLFRSHQPTGLLLDPARTIPAEKEYGGSRKRDRRRMTRIWEQFQNDGTP